MRAWSFAVGRFFGVEVRIHAFFLLLLGMSISFGTILSGSGSSGLGLWFMLFSAVLVREIARAIVCVWFGLDIRSILLMPTGGLSIFASQDDTARASTPLVERSLAVAGPFANLLAGAILFGFIAGVAPAIHLLARPFVSPGALLRSFVWVQLLLGAIHLLPAFPLDAGRILRSELARFGARAKSGESLKRSQQAVLLGQLIAGALIVLGWIMNNLIVVMAGLSVFAAAHLEGQGVLLQTKVDSVRMKDVMLTEFSTLSASATLEDALDQAIHTLQDVFPVVRAGNLVGAVSRQGIFDALQTEGNGYVQGVMTRSFHTAQPDDSLVKTLQRITTGQGAQLVPVVEGERVVGIITPQNLSQSMTVLNQSKKLQGADRKGRAEAGISSVDEVLDAATREPEEQDGRKTGQALAPGLYLVATPIGNLEDITLRALRVLRSVDRIACEDTRQTQKLLNHFGIKTPTVSYHMHNEGSRAEELTVDLKAGARVAVVSDAGTPGIADPGGQIAAAAIAGGVPIFPVPGANAAISALIASGLGTERFTFHGFLPAKAGARKTALEVLPRDGVTHIFYEAPHRILDTLTDVDAVFGTGQKIVVARELTKLHEEFLRGNVAELRAELSARAIVRGEIVLLLSPAEVESNGTPTGSIAAEVAALIAAEGLTEMTALKRVAKERGLGKSEAYRELQREQNRKR